MLTNWAPLKLTQLALLGSLVMASEILGLSLAWCLFRGFRDQHPGSFVEFILVLGPILIGAPLSVLARKRLNAGLGKNKWTAQEVEIAHRWIESRILTRIAKSFLWASRLFVSGLLLYWAASYIWKFSVPSGISSIFLSVIWLDIPLDVLRKLRAALRPEPPPRVPPKGWAGTINGIYSEHWGGRKTPTSNPN